MTTDTQRRAHLTRVPPHDDATEANLLGAAMLNRDAAAVCAGVPADTFYRQHTTLVADAIRDLFEAGKPTDTGTVAAVLREGGQLDSIREGDRVGATLLLHYVTDVPFIGGAATWAEMLQRFARERAILSLAHAISDGVYAKVDIAGLVAELNARVDEVVTAASSTWEAVNLAAVLAGEGDEAKPEFLLRTDGQPLLYPGRVHAFNAESESGKSWLALWACLERVEAGQHVLYIDFEDEAVDVVGRLLAMGAEPAQLLERFHYVRPDDPIDMAARLRVAAMLKAWPVVLCVIDGVAEAMGISGWNEDRSPDIVAFYAALPRVVARSGAAVVLIDHLVKDREKQGNDARGGGHKRAGILCSYKLEVTSPFGRDRTGKARLLVTKDRPGYIRGVAAGNGQVAGEMVLESSHGGSAVTLQVRPPTGGSDAPWEGPTRCMEAVEAALRERAGDEFTGRQLDAVLRGRGQSYRNGTVSAAAERLVSEGRCQVRSGPRNSRLFSISSEHETLGDDF